MRNVEATLKTVLITGGSSGIGKALVHAFALQSYDVVFTYRSGKSKADELLQELSDFPVRAVFWDASNRESLKKLKQIVPKVDILINNAGLGSATVARISEDIYEQDRLLLEVNAVAPLWLIRSYIEQMKSDGGVIINISSVGGGITQFPGFSPADGMSKAALTFLTKQLAAELAHDPVHVFAVCPGATETPMFGASTLDHLSENERSKLLQKLPGKRLISPTEIADICLYLATENARVLRGSILDASLGLGSNPGLLQK